MCRRFAADDEGVEAADSDVFPHDLVQSFVENGRRTVLIVFGLERCVHTRGSLSSLQVRLRRGLPLSRPSVRVQLQCDLVLLGLQ